MRLRSKKTHPKPGFTCVLILWRNRTPGVVEEIYWNCKYDPEEDVWGCDYGDEVEAILDFDCWLYYSEVETLIGSLADVKTNKK